MTSLNKNRNGFTLIEVIIAMAILAIMATAFMGMFSSAYGFIMNAGRKSEAVFATEQVLEDVIASGVDPTGLDTGMVFNFTGGESATVEGLSVTRSEVYGTQSSTVSLESFVSDDSITAGVYVAPSDMPLQIGSNEKNLKIFETATIEVNKPVTWTSSNAALVQVDAAGVITALNLGTNIIITATSNTPEFGLETAVCVVNVVTQVVLRDVKGGEYVRYEGVAYIKLSGNNGRVLIVSDPYEAYDVNWNHTNDIIDLPAMSEVSGGVWTDDIRNSSSQEYWLRDSPNASSTYYVKPDGTFGTKHRNSGISHFRRATALSPTLVVISGLGTLGSPYIVEDIDD